jgi:hypothetical protein
MDSSRRGRLLTTFAVLFGLLAISNFLKPLQIGAQTGFVLFGERLSGTPNTIAGPLFGLFLAAYALAIWRMRRAALPMSWLYATYVLLNLVLYTVRTPQPSGVGHLLFGLVYSAVALGVSVGAAVALTRRRHALA